MGKGSLSDVWRNVGDHISVFTCETADSIPELPGVYAWFYPLIISTTKIEDFLAQIKYVFEFDAQTADMKPTYRAEFIKKWRIISLTSEFVLKPPDLNESLRATWDKVVGDADTFFDFRRKILAASILMPPLYVGKTGNLYKRYKQHVDINKKQNEFNNFATRFNEHISQCPSSMAMAVKSINDLLYGIISFSPESDQSNYTSDSEYLLEELLKFTARPIYSIK